MENAEEHGRPVLIQDEFTRPRTTLEAPAGVRELLEAQALSLRRVTVAQVVGKNNEPLVNSLRLVGAKHNERPSGDTLEDAITKTMRIISAHLEELGEGARYRITPYHVDRDDKTTRGKSRAFDFAGIHDAPDREGENGHNAEHFEMLRYLTAQNRQMLAVLGESRLMIADVRGALKTVAVYGETITGRLTDALVREREATQALSEAKSETLVNSQAHEVEMAKLEQRRELLELMSPLMQKATSELGVKAAETLGSGKSKKAEAANPLAGMAAKKEAVEKAKEEAAHELLSDEEKDEARIAGYKEEHPDLFSVAMLHRSLTDTQETSLREAFGEDAWGHFEGAAKATDNAAALDALVLMVEASPKESTAQVLSILDGKQQGVLGSLRFSVERHKKES